MKKLWMLPVLLLAAVACSDDNGGDDVPPPSADQHVTCEISAPADGAEVDMSAKMTIEGDAEIENLESDIDRRRQGRERRYVCTFYL